MTTKTWNLLDCSAEALEGEGLAATLVAMTIANGEYRYAVTVSGRVGITVPELVDSLRAAALYLARGGGATEDALKQVHDEALNPHPTKETVQ